MTRLRGVVAALESSYFSLGWNLGIRRSFGRVWGRGLGSRACARTRMGDGRRAFSAPAVLELNQHYYMRTTYHFLAAFGKFPREGDPRRWKSGGEEVSGLATP